MQYGRDLILSEQSGLKLFEKRLRISDGEHSRTAVAKRPGRVDDLHGAGASHLFDVTSYADLQRSASSY